MATQNVNYQCPCCTGPLHYSGTSERLECDYCGSSFSVEEIKALYSGKEESAQAASAAAMQAEAAAQAAGENENAEYFESEPQYDADLKVYSCPSCGAELVFDATTAATSCPYCGNPTIIPGQYNGDFRPDYVIPFKLDRETAIASLKNFYKDKKLLPKAFSNENHIEEIKGVYVPFWLIDGSAVFDMDYEGTKVSSMRGPREIVTFTDYYDVRRTGALPFSRIPVDASSKMPDAHMDSIEPYDYSALKPFSTAYLPGFMADKYDLSVDECMDRVKVRAVNTTESLVDGDAASGGYATCVRRGGNIDVKRTGYKQALLPVWLLSTTWKGNRYLFAMNGQTGKFIGDLPVDNGRYWATLAKIAVPMAAILSLLFWFL